MTTRHTDDTVLDALAAEVRANPPLGAAEVAALLARARTDPHGEAAAALVEHHLFLCLEVALKKPSAQLEVADLFQEGSVALVAAVSDYAEAGGDAAGLREHLRTAVSRHVDAVAAEAARRHDDDEAFVRDIRLLEAAEVELRHRLGRDATAREVAAILEWEEERVAVVAAMLSEARALNDASLLAYLDDLDDVDRAAGLDGVVGWPRMEADGA